MRDVCTNFGAESGEFNGETDHAHQLLHYPPKVALSRLVGSLKGVSARRLRQESPDTSANTCGVNTSGPRPTSPHPAQAPRSPW